MNSTGAGVTTIGLAFGGLGITLEVEDNELAQRIRAAYRDFLGTPETPLRLQVAWKARPADPAGQDAVLNISSEALTITAVEMSAYIDFRSQHGNLVIHSDFPGRAVEATLRQIFALLAVQAGGFLYHGAGIIHAGAGWLFFGPSGSGKTTVARCSTGDLILNDDLVLLRKGAQGWTLHSTPFTHPGQNKPTPAEIPLTAMFRLVQDSQVFLETLGRGQTLAEVIANIPIMAGKSEFTSALLGLAENLIDETPIYRLHFLPDRSFWAVIDRLRT